MPSVSVSMQVKGADEFRELVNALKDAGNKGLKTELAKGLSRATKPLKPLAQESAKRNLPQRGGLAADVANSRFAVKRRTSGNQVGIRFTATSKHDIRSMDRGRLRWPVFPKPTQTRNQWIWRERRIRPGWWSEFLESRVSKTARDEVERSVEMVKRKLESAAR